MTIIKHSSQRVGVLIDAQNLYHSAQNLYGSRVNFTKVLEEAVAGRVLVRAIAYVITSESGEESTFFEALETAGIETKAKDLQIFSGGAKKADWDVGIAVDAMKLSQSLDAIVIASGDGDFIPAVEYIQHSTGCQVEVISFGRSTSSALIEVVDDFIDMCEDRDEFLMNSRTARRHNKRKFGNNSRHYHNRSDDKAPTDDNKTEVSDEVNDKSDAKTGTKTEAKKLVAKRAPRRAPAKATEKKELLETKPKKLDTSKPRVAIKKDDKKPATTQTSKTTPAKQEQKPAAKRTENKRPARASAVKKDTSVKKAPAKNTKKTATKRTARKTPAKKKGE